MKCFYHPETEGASECRLCGHPLCGPCSVDVKGSCYCGDCLRARLEGAPPRGVRPGDRSYKSPKSAGWLSVVPGLGLLYLGEYMKALVVLLIVMGACQIAGHGGGILVPMVWAGQIVYAVQEARRLNQLRLGAPAPEEPVLADEKDSPVWGGILVGIGVLFLLDQLDLIRFSEIFEKFWPVLIIVLGLQILMRARRSGSVPQS